MTFNAYMHERNIYRNQPDFAKLAIDYPEFHKYIIPDAKGQKARIDFSNTEALRMLTKILLKKDFNLDIEIPQGFLIPTVPQRLNYILWLEDLLSNVPQNKSEYENIQGIDIGTGACAIFAVLGAQKNNWKFVATETSDDAIEWATKNIEKNNLQEYVTVVKVNEGDSSLNEILSSNAHCFHFCMCNPPFFENPEEIRKKRPNLNETIADVAQKDEIFADGGELNFVRNILKDSLTYKNRICIFTSMFGKKKSFLQILKELKEIPDAKLTSTEFCQGNTIRWGVAWTFDQSIQFQKEVKKRPKVKKAKPPLEYEIFLNKSQKFNTVVEKIEIYLKNLEISYTVVRSSQNFTELLLKSDKNTWTHQRRKRRELERHKKDKNQDQAVTTITSVENVHSLKKEDDKESLKLYVSTSENASLKDNDVIIKDDKTDIQILCHGNKEVPVKKLTADFSSEIKSQNETSFLSICDSECTKKLLVLKTEKRKLDLNSEDSTFCKKAKIDVTNDTEIISAEKCILSEENSAKSLSSNSNDDAISNSNVKSHSVSVDKQYSSSSSNETEGNSPNKNKTDSFNERENEGMETKESVNSFVDYKKAQPEGLVLHCYLQFLKGKNKIHVKMNCPPTADRNTMYQVFQLIKNKINGS